MQLPRGYVGTNHETIGSDVMAVLATLRAPEEVLGSVLYSRLKDMDPNAWYPISTLLGLLDHLSRRVGVASVMKMGRQLFVDSHKKHTEKSMTSAGDVVFGIDGLYHRANRGEQIGGWVVKRFRPGLAVLEKTTPHHCALEEGILLEALHGLGAECLITQTQCVRRGDDLCVFELHSAVRDERWMGKWPIV
jgi:hypothetical protein